jgi:hypothetical protein
MNRRGEKPVSLSGIPTGNEKPIVMDLAEQDSLTRFDKSKRKKKRNKNRNGKNNQPNPQNGN